MSDLEEPAAIDASDAPLQSFIVRIWVETSAQPGFCAQWRGSVQHVNSGDKRYVDDMEEIVAFFESHLAQHDIQRKPAERAWWRKLLRR